MMHITVKSARRALAVALAASTVAALSACSGGGTPAEPDAGDSIKIGVVTSVGSPVTNYPDVQVGAQAAIKQINADGGVNGRDLELVFCNTRGDTNQAAACGRDIDEAGVVASVGQANTYTTSTWGVTNAKGIPEIGNIPFGDDLTYTSELSHPFSAGHPGNWIAGAFAAQQQGAKKIVAVAIDVPGGINGADLTEEAAEGLGLEVAERIIVPATGVTDYAPFAQRIIESGAQAAVIIHGPAGLSAIAKASDSLGSKVQLFASSYTLGQSEAATIPTLAPKIIIASSLPSVNDTSSAAVTEYLKELDADGVPETLELRRLAGFNAWISVHAAAKLFEGIDGEITRESVQEALGSTDPIELYDLAPYDPASLGGADLGDKFPRVPKAPVYFLTFKDGLMVDAGLDPIEDALQYNR